MIPIGAPCSTSVQYLYNNFQILTATLTLRTGYLAWEYPTNRLLQRLPLAKYSAFCIVVWGVVSATDDFSSGCSLTFGSGTLLFRSRFQLQASPGPEILSGCIRGWSDPWIRVIHIPGTHDRDKIYSPPPD